MVVGRTRGGEKRGSDGATRPCQVSHLGVTVIGQTAVETGASR